MLEDGRVLEKAAANISVVRGKLSAQRAAAMSSRGRGEIDPKGGQDYAAAAMSLVFHSAHPLIPTLRADVRLFQAGGAGGSVTRATAAAVAQREGQPGTQRAPARGLRLCGLARGLPRA